MAAPSAVNCEILIPAALEGQITKDNAGQDQGQAW
jgi:glutamate dehydrogenase/leucine dehydrogenase